MAASKASSTATAVLGEWVSMLGAKAPTPGGGAAAAVAASIGAASGAMASIYTTRKKDVESGVAVRAEALANTLNEAAKKCLEIADEDARAYAALQSTWKKDCALSDEEKAEIAKQALEVPVKLLKVCHEQATAVHEFLPECNPNITSDAKVALHLLAGGARAAWQTVLVNQPNEELKTDLSVLLREMTTFENNVLGLTTPTKTNDVAE